MNRRLIDQRDRNRRRNDDVLRIVRQVRQEVDDLWLESWRSSSGLPVPKLLRQTARDLASYSDTNVKRAVWAITKELSE